MIVVSYTDSAVTCIIFITPAVPNQPFAEQHLFGPNRTVLRAPKRSRSNRTSLPPPFALKHDCKVDNEAAASHGISLMIPTG